MNLTTGERTALKKLSERGIDAVIIIDLKDYIGEAESQKKKKDNYNRLKYDPTETFNILVNDTIKRFKRQKMMKKKLLKD